MMHLDTIGFQKSIVAVVMVLATTVWSSAPALASAPILKRSDRPDRYANNHHADHNANVNDDANDNNDYYVDEYSEEVERRQQTTTQNTTGLTQQADLISACRYSPNNLDVFADAAQTQRLLTIAPYTPVTLTGVVGSGIAEIRHPADGWISALTLESCSDPSVPIPDPDETACYRVLTNVTVRTAPSIRASALGYIRTGGIAYATTNPPNEVFSSDGRTWIEIDDFLGSDGWIAITGANNTGTNAVRLAGDECERE